MHLPAKEFDKLLLLVENNGRALSKDEMMSAIWHDSFVEESNLAKQISRLRKLLDTKGEGYIETLPKHGYRFSADIRRTIIERDEPVVLEKRTVKRVTFEVEDEDPPPKTLPAAARPLFTWPRVAIVAIIGALAIAATVVLIQRNRNAAKRINSVAVLPLQSINPEEDTKALGLGLTDALITKLGSLKQVIVRPTTAVASFSSPNNLIDAGRRLNVDAILEGTIQEADGRLRVNARLIRTSTGEQMWTERFEQPSAGIFALQGALSTSIAKALAFELNKADSVQLLQRGTTNSEAYEKYLRGRFYQSQNTAEGFDRSIEFYQQAIALDPNFAEAYAGVGDANLLKFNFGTAKPEDVIADARQAVQKALQLNPELSNAYTSLALIRFLIDGNWPEAERGLQRALELDPNNADAFNRYGYFLMRLGRFNEALEKFFKAREINPLGAIIQSNIGLTYLCANRYREAIEQLERTAAENPRFSHAIWLLQTAYEAAGDHEKAFEAGLKGLEIEGGAELANRLRSVKQRDGLEAANRLWLDESIKTRESGFVTPLAIAMRAATMKDREQTLRWLEKAVEERDTTVGGIRYLSKFDFVRDDPRFQAMLEKLAF